MHYSRLRCLWECRERSDGRRHACEWECFWRRQQTWRPEWTAVQVCCWFAQGTTRSEHKKHDHQEWSTNKGKKKDSETNPSCLLDSWSRLIAQNVRVVPVLTEVGLWYGRQGSTRRWAGSPGGRVGFSAGREFWGREGRVGGTSELRLLPELLVLVVEMVDTRASGASIGVS